MVFYFEMRLFGFSFNRHACGARQQSYSAAFRAKPCPGAMQKMDIIEVAPGRIVLRAA
jgi:hypothetical protein